MQTTLARLLAAAALLFALAGCSIRLGSGEARPTSVPLPTVADAPTIVPQPVGGSGGGSGGGGQAAPTSVPIAQGRAPLQQSQIIADVFNRVAPAVVLIQVSSGLGSGFLIDNQGHIVTNNHVIERAQDGQVIVSFSNLFQAVGEVVGTDPSSDTAVVRVSQLPAGITPVELGDSDLAAVGDLVIAIGNPLGQERTVTSGIVSAVGRTISEQNNPYDIGGAIQTDAAINPGNSGGPLLDAQGRVIGMNTAILSPSGANSGIGFAVPVNLIKRVAPELISSGSYSHPYLGVQMLDVTNLVAEQQGLPGAGVLIRPSADDSPVAQAGLDGPAILQSINGRQITSSADVIAYLELNRAPGETVSLTLLGDGGATRQLDVQLGARPGVEDVAPGTSP